MTIELTRFDKARSNIYSKINISHRHMMNRVSNTQTYAYARTAMIVRRTNDMVKLWLTKKE